MTLLSPKMVDRGPLTPQVFGAKGDGVTDDSAAWAAFQAVAGLKFVPPGNYLVNGAVLQFVTGCYGNGVFNDSSPPNYNWGYWDQVWGQREGHSLITHFRDLDGNSPPPVSPAIKLQTRVRYDYVGDPGAAPDFARGAGIYHELIGEGDFATVGEAQTGNFWGIGSTVHNKFAGRMGMAAIIGRAWDARESEVPNILTYGSSKSTGAGFQVHRRSLFSSGAYMIGCEAFVSSRADETLDIPYLNDDSLVFEEGSGFTTAFHAKVFGGNDTYKGAPVTAGMIISGNAGARHGCYNGIVVGGGAFKINNQGEGAAGTVGINLASHREGRYSEIGIKFRRNHRHLWFREGGRVQSALTRFLNEDGSCGVSVECSGNASGNSPFVSFRDSTDNTFSPSARTIGLVEAFPSNFQITSKLGEVRIQAEDGAGIYVALADRFAPATSQDNTKALGGPSRRWSEVFAGTGTINTSDERLKEQVTDLSEAERRVALACRGLIKKYKWKDAVVRKGADARWHFGVIAQELIAAFAAEGLDASDYGILCYDEWEAQPERVLTTRSLKEPAVYEQVLVAPERTQMVEVDPGVFEEEVLPAEYRDGAMISGATYEETTTVTPAVEAGNRYGVRYDELSVFILSALIPEAV